MVLDIRETLVTYQPVKFTNSENKVSDVFLYKMKLLIEEGADFHDNILHGNGIEWKFTMYHSGWKPDEQVTIIGKYRN